MAKDNTNTKKGFTIIEVVLVLAIAGLIFLMVFVALPALQRSQRDTARRNDLARVDTSLVQYQTNNQGTNDGSNLPFNSSVYYGYTSFEGNATSLMINGVSQQVGGACGTRPTSNANSNGKAMACIFLRDYMNSGTAGTNKTNEFQDPAGTYYGMDITKLTSGQTKTYADVQVGTKDGTSMDYVVHVFVSAKCSGENAIYDTARHFAILYRLEGAGTYCIDDQ